MLRRGSLHPEMIANDTISLSKASLEKNPENLSTLNIPRRSLVTILRCYKRQIIWVTIYFLLQILLFGLGTLQYMRDPDTPRLFFAAALVAMGFGMVLQVNCGIFVFLPALRRTTTFLKRTWMAKYVPFDSLIGFHIVVSGTVCLATVGHIIARLINFYYYSLVAEAKTHGVTFELMISESGNVGTRFLGYTVLSGWVALACLLVMGIFALPPLRNSGLHDVFYWTHKLQIVFWAALIVHAPDFWKVMCIPFALYLVEKGCKYGTVLRWAPVTKVQKMYALPGEVTHLIINRPEGFVYYPGNYCFIKAPSLGVCSWHPFTISSYPEQADHIGFHIKASGNYTAGFGKLFQKRIQSLEAVESTQTIAGLAAIDPNKHAVKLISSIKASLKPVRRKVRDQIFVDGPYASSGAELFTTEHAVFIGAGIGVTPFLSMLGSLLAQSKLAKRTVCPNCDHQYRPSTVLEPLRINGRRLKLKKVDFIWITRDAEKVAWVAKLLQDWDEHQREPQANPFLSYQIYVTVPKPGDMENSQSMYGLRTKPLSGRPAWPVVFDELKKQESRKLRVFYCGPRAMEEVLRECCGRYKFGFSWENF